MKLRATGQTLELVESERLVSGSVEIYTAADYDAMSASSLNNTASPTGANMGDGKAQTIQFAQSAVQDYQIYSGQVKIWVR